MQAIKHQLVRRISEAASEKQEMPELFGKRSTWLIRISIVLFFGMIACAVIAAYLDHTGETFGSDSSKYVRLIDTESLTVVSPDGASIEIWREAFEPELAFDPRCGNLTVIEISDDGQTLVTGGTFYKRQLEGAVHIWELSETGSSGKLTPTLLLRIRTKLRGQSPTAVAFSPDGKLIAIGTQDASGVGASIIIVDRESLNITQTITGSTNSVLQMEFTADGRQLIVAEEWFGTNLAGQIRLVELKSGSDVYTAAPHSVRLIDVWIDRENEVLFSIDETGLMIETELQTGKTITQNDVPVDSVSTIAVSPGGAYLAVSAYSPGKQGPVNNRMLGVPKYDSTIFIWNVREKRIVETISTGDWIDILEFLPDEESLLAGKSYGSKARVYKLSSLE